MQKIVFAVYVCVTLKLATSTLILIYISTCTKWTLF